jgi:phosphate:Na+ symporter
VLTGTAITALLQSSSMVSLLILAFASAGIMPLVNAIGVLLGANLGTTFTGWIVATLGFKLHLDALAFPAMGIGALLQVFGEQREKLRATGLLIFGVGLLLLGLSLMKESVAMLPDYIDVSRLQSLNAFTFLLLGMGLTALIQSSSATMMIALTALSTGMIELSGAAALIIGADLGTTSTTILGSIKGSAIKRQLAYSHVIFNLVTNSLAFIFLLPLMPQLMQWLRLEDPLFSLVAFHSCFNFMGLLIFIPILNRYANWASKTFVGTDKKGGQLEDTPVAVPDVAIKVCQNHVAQMLANAHEINLSNLKIKPIHLTEQATKWLTIANNQSQRFERAYEKLKQQEGALLHYTAKIQTQKLTEAQSTRLTSLVDCARDVVYAVKTLKDIRANILALQNQEVPLLNEFSKSYQVEMKTFYQRTIELLANEHDDGYIQEQILELSQQCEGLHQSLHDAVHRFAAIGNLEAEQLSTLFNVNRETWQSGKYLIEAIIHWYHERPVVSAID